MAAPGLTKLFDKLNIVEIQIRNVLFKSICCGVFKRSPEETEPEAIGGQQTGPTNNQVMQSRHEEPGLGISDIDYLETKPSIANDNHRPLTTQSAPHSSTTMATGVPSSDHKN